jgi:hypothetical protein
MKIVHLPYTLDPNNRQHDYENLWKQVALKLLTQRAGNVSGWTLLDYGCGRGETMAMANTLGMKCTGVDTDPQCVRLAKSHGTAGILDPLHPGLILKPKAYDVVACFHVLEHVDNPKVVLSLLAASARRYCLVAVPNLARFPNLGRLWREPAYVNSGHLQSWDHAHFRTLAELHCGLKVVAWGYDALIVSPLDRLLLLFLGQATGNRLLKFLETRIFNRLLPYACTSVIALMEPSE